MGENLQEKKKSVLTNLSVKSDDLQRFVLFSSCLPSFSHLLELALCNLFNLGC